MVSSEHEEGSGPGHPLQRVGPGRGVGSGAHCGWLPRCTATGIVTGPPLRLRVSDKLHDTFLLAYGQTLMTPMTPRPRKTNLLPRLAYGQTLMTPHDAEASQNKPSSFSVTNSLHCIEVHSPTIFLGVPTNRVRSRPVRTDDSERSCNAVTAAAAVDSAATRATNPH